MLIEIKTATITEKGQIALPKKIRDKKGFKVGTKVAILSFEDRIEILPLKKISERMETAYLSEKILSKDWNSKEDDKTWRDL